MKKNDKKKKGGVLLITLLTALIAAVLYYFWIPAVNAKSLEFWAYLIVVSVVFCGLYYLNYAIRGKGKTQNAGLVPVMVTGLLVLVLLLMGIFGSSRLFHAIRYSTILTVKEGTVDHIPSAEGTDSIALMDTASAEKLGNREIGSLSQVVSQYDVSEYTQIDAGGTPVKVSALRYAGLFKWHRNRKNGVPGYVIVDPVSMEADYVSLKEGMRYVPSAYLQEDLARKIRFQYPTRLFDNLHFEIDEEGAPWYLASTYDHTIGLFGGKQVTGVIQVSPVTGQMQWHAVGDIPQWMDVVYGGDLICTQYNDYAQLHAGFWNSVFGQTGCRKVTEYAKDEDEEAYADFGYISKDGDIWIYTGVTSLNNDSSNIGFILSNERTEETIFIPCAGADEFSAMASAQGEVQEKRYQASFPSLILVDGCPTYIMVLKDASGLVKMYAAVNVEQYNLVATASTQKDCIAKYRALMNGRISKEEAVADGVTVDTEPEAEDRSAYKRKSVTIRKLRTIDQDGNTWLYLVDTANHIYSARYADVIGMLLVDEGDTISIFTDGEHFLLAE